MSLPSLKKNIIYIAAGQAGNTLIQLSIIPYIARVLGPTVYGEFAWIQVIILFGIVVTDYGFGWSASRDVSQIRHDKNKLSQIFANVLCIQLILFILFVLVVGLIMAHYAPSLSVLFVIATGSILGNILSPMWLFQGLEKLHNGLLLQLSSRLLFLPIIFLFVRNPRDIINVFVYLSASSMFCALTMTHVILRRYNLFFRVPNLAGSISLFKQGSLLFCPKLMTTSYTIFIPFAIGAWAGDIQLAWYSIAEKYKLLVLAVLAPVSQALYPRISWLFGFSSLEAWNLIVKSSLPMLMLSFVAGIILWFYPSFWMSLAGGREFESGYETLRWLAFVPFIVNLSNIIGTQILIPLRKNMDFTLSIGLGSISALLLGYPLINGLGAKGAAILNLIAELLVASSMIIFSYKIVKRRAGN